MTEKDELVEAMTPDGVQRMIDRAMRPLKEGERYWTPVDEAKFMAAFRTLAAENSKATFGFCFMGAMLDMPRHLVPGPTTSRTLHASTASSWEAIERERKERREQQPAKKTERKSKVFWQPKELECVMDTAFELFLADPWSFQCVAEFVDKAQNRCLPQHRRRAINSSVALTLNAVDELRSRFMAWRDKMRVPPAPIVVKEPPPPPVLQKTVRDFDTQELVAELTRRATDSFAKLASLAASIEAIAKMPPARPAPLSPTTPAVEPRPKLRVAVVGLLDGQTEHVADRMKTLDLDLRFMDSTLSVPSFPAVNAIVVTKFAGHHWYDAAQAAVGNEHVHFTDGGLTSVCKLLAELNDKHWKRLAIKANNNH